MIQHDLYSIISDQRGIDNDQILKWVDEHDKQDLARALIELSTLFNHDRCQKKKLTAALYGRASETQMTLFDDNQELRALYVITDESVVTFENNENQESSQEEKTPGKKSKGRHSALDPDSLPQTRTDVEPDDPLFLANKDKCVEVKETVHRTIEKIPAKYICHNVICHNYVYNDDEGNTVYFPAKLPEAKLIEGSLASPSLVASIAVNKVVLGLPLYRQETEFYKQGLCLSRQNLFNWLKKCFELHLSPVYDRIRSDFGKQSHVHIDETVLRVIQNDKSKSNPSIGTIIVGQSGRFEQDQITLYVFSSNKTSASIKSFMPEGYSGTIMCDAAPNHMVFDKATIMFCMAHARRKFTEELATRADYKLYKKLTPQERLIFLQKEKNLSLKLLLGIVDQFDQLYKIERTSRELDESPDLILARRQKESRPAFEELVKRIKQVNKLCMPKSSLRQATEYFLSRKKGFARYLEDGESDIDDNRCERSVKPFVLGRKNFLFANTAYGAQITAVYYTLLQTAIHNGLNPETWLSYALKRLSNEPLSDELIEEILPYSDKLPKELYVTEQLKKRAEKDQRA